MESILTVTVAATTHDLTTLDTVKDELGSPNVSDATLERWISDSSVRCAEYCNRVFAKETVTEEFALTGGRYVDALGLSRIPVVALTSVVIDGTTLDASEYRLNASSGLLHRLCQGARSIWAGCKIVVTYSGGYELIGDLPRTIEQACLILVRQRMSARMRDPMLKSLELPGVVTETYWVDTSGNGADMPPDAAGLLERHRRIVL